MMRPAVLRHGHRLRARLFMRLVQGLTRQPIDPVIRMALYRPSLFGEPFLALVSDVLRGPSFWTAAEREHLAAFTSQLNECGNKPIGTMVAPAARKAAHRTGTRAGALASAAVPAVD